MHDFILLGGPTEFVLFPSTEDAKDWMKLHIPDGSKFLGKGVVILRGYLDEILKGIDDDGLKVKDARNDIQ